MRYSRRRVAGLLAMLGLLGAVELWRYLSQDGITHSDFFGIWSWSRFVATQGVGALYDQGAMLRFQHDLDPSYTDSFYPFLYPPTYLLFIGPLGYLPLWLARLLWSGATLAAFLVALCGWRWRTMLAAAAVVAPATVLCLICGQNGLLTAALMIGGLRCAAARPLLGGVLLGLLTYKPHLALLVPVALIAAGLWPALLAAGVTAIVGVATSSLVFGIEPWSAWLAAQAASWATVDAFISEHLNMIPTVSAALRQLGLSAGVVVAGQVVATSSAACAIWVMWRRHGAGTRSIVVLTVAALLATPYAFIYDLPMLSGATLLALAEIREGELSPSARAFFGSALLLPQLMFQLQNATLPLAAPILILILLWLLLPRDGAPMSHSPFAFDLKAPSRWRERVG